MKQILSLVFFFVLSAFFFSCNNDNPSNPGGGSTSGSFQAEWAVETVQMVQAPFGSSGSDIMKQLLVPFGEVSGNFVGNFDMKFGAELINSENTTLPFGESYFAGNTGYYFGSDNRSLFVSANGGSTWNSITFPSSISVISELFVYNENTIFAIAAQTISTYLLFKSTNQGASWQTINNNLNIQFFSGDLNKSLSFVNENTGYLVGRNSTSNICYKTTNGGLNWNSMYSWSVSNGFEGMKFFSASNGVIATQSASGAWCLKKTTDGGASWTDLVYPEFAATGNTIPRLIMLNENIGWIYGLKYEGIEKRYYLYKTINGGQSWSLVTMSVPFTSLKFINENTGYAIASETTLLKTNNGGVNWTSYATPVYRPEYWGVNLFNEQPAFYSSGKYWKPSGIIDTSKWVASGEITNSAITLIVSKAPRYQVYANGDFSINSNNIVFNVYNYLNTYNKTGTGTFTFENGFLSIELNLPENEKWKIKLRKK